MICCQRQIDKRKFEETETHWYSIYLCTIFILFDGIQFSMFFVSMWPYLKTIDPSATATFFGLITAAFSLGQGISSPLFGFWSNKVKSVKPPLTISLIMMMISNVTYASIELFAQQERRYIMLAARLLIGLAAGDVAVLRAYAATAALPKDRAKAVVLSSASWPFGLTIGPAIPVIFAPLGYPGWKIFGKLNFDMYTAPAWVSFINNVLSLIVLHIFFREVYIRDNSDNSEDDSNSQRPNKLNKFGIFLILVSRVLLLIVYTNNETIGSLFSMTMYNWSNAQAVKYYGFIQLGLCAFDFIFNIVFVSGLAQYLNNHNRERIASIIGFVLMLIFHILTFPWPFWPNKLKYNVNHVNQTATEITGCYSQTYSWCSSTHQVPLVVYAFSMIVIMGSALPIAFIPINTLYSKILGNRRQGTMTGLLFTAGSFARTVGPILVSYLFDHYGPDVTWGMEMVVLGVTIGIWIIFYRQIDRSDNVLKGSKQFQVQNSIESLKTETISIERL